MCLLAACVHTKTFSRRKHSTLSRPDSTRALTQLARLSAGIVAIAALYFARVVFVPFALAILFAFLLTPVVRLLDRIRIPRAVSSVAVVIMAVLALGLLGWVVTGQLIDVADQLPSYRSNIKHKIASLHSTNNQSINKAADAVNEIGKELVAPGTATAPPASPVSPRGIAIGGGSSAKPIPVEVVPPAGSP